MIRSGNNRSVPELKKLWKECFADEDAYIDAFFEAMYEDQSVLLEEENGVLLGASFFLPGKIRRKPACRAGRNHRRGTRKIMVSGSRSGMSMHSLSIHSTADAASLQNCCTARRRFTKRH